jgi:N-acetylneuraminate lyase
MKNFQGILPAVVTPLDDRGRFQPDAFAQLIERLYKAEIDGVYVCGQTGEGLQQSLEQRKAVAEAAVRLSPHGKTVIVHVGAASTADAIALARHASQTGAHAISSLPPAGRYSFAEIRDYYRDLAAASDIPLLVYYFPSAAPALHSADQMLELCDLQNVAGLKFTDSDLFKLWLLRRAGAVVFNGTDEMLAAGLIMGASGGIGSIYNLIPEQFVALYRHAMAGCWEEARRVQNGINELIEPILRYPVHAAIKAILRWNGIDCGACIAPRRQLTPDEESDLLARIAATSLGRELLAVKAHG